MRKDIVKIRKSDDLRAILTDVLPYEVPLLFSNEGLYSFLKSHPATIFKDRFGIDLLSNQKFTIPYNYKIKKNPIDFRALSVMHPAQQIEIASFYKNYSGAILAQCQKSTWALRAPFDIASYYVEKSRARRESAGRSGTVETTSSVFGGTSKTASSYFTYKRYGFLYKFFESTEFHSLEKRFGLLLKLDIAQCFSRIYTHTIAWAVKSKEYAKQNLRSSSANTFEAVFDQLMQRANHAETAGILIGPEISRIFAEIILQQIDIDIEKRLLARNRPLRCGVDYEVRRYVDDYFVFANNRDDLDAIQICISECLAPYRLSINDAKSSCIARPFSTGETSARIDLASMISTIFDRAVKSEQITGADGKTKTIHKPARIHSPEKLANVCIRDIKRTLKAHDTVFDTASNYFFSTAKRLIVRHKNRIEIQALDLTQLEWATNFLLAIIEIIFFFYASSPRVRQTYLISEIVLLIIDYVKTGPSSTAERVFTKIAQEIKSHAASQAMGEHDDNIEQLNLLLVLQQLGDEYTLDRKGLIQALGLSYESGKPAIPNRFGYFQIATSIYLIANDTRHKELKDALVSHILNLYAAAKDWHARSDLVMLLLDISASPYIGQADKINILKAALRHTGDRNLTARCNEFLTLTCDQQWFFNWSKEIALSDVLQRKELRTPY